MLILTGKFFIVGGAVLEVTCCLEAFIGSAVTPPQLQKPQMSPNFAAGESSIDWKAWLSHLPPV